MLKRILVIDNDHDILELITLILQEDGYDVTASKSGDILDKLSQIKPDLILLDDWLNGTKGRELCRSLKSIHLSSNIPIIIISAINGLEQIANECGADGFIQKPFDIEYLLEVIASNLYKTAG